MHRATFGMVNTEREIESDLERVERDVDRAATRVPHHAQEALVLRPSPWRLGPPILLCAAGAFGITLTARRPVGMLLGLLPLAFGVGPRHTPSPSSGSAGQLHGPSSRPSGRSTADPGPSPLVRQSGAGSSARQSGCDATACT